MLPTLAQAKDLTIFEVGLGSSTANSMADEKSTAYNFEMIVPYKGQTVVLGYMNEGHKRGPIGKRDGVYVQDMGTRKVTRKVSISAALGLYFTTSTVPADNKLGYVDRYDLNGLGSLALSYKVDRSHAVEFSVYRVFLSGNKDADIFLARYSFSL